MELNLQVGLFTCCQPWAVCSFGPSSDAIVALGVGGRRGASPADRRHPPCPILAVPPLHPLPPLHLLPPAPGAAWTTRAVESAVAPHYYYGYGLVDAAVECCEPPAGGRPHTPYWPLPVAPHPSEARCGARLQALTSQ